MPLEGEYEPSPMQFVRDQVETYESSGGSQGNVQSTTGRRVVIVTSRGHRTGKLRKMPLMRVEHEGEYALVASKGGSPENPEWYYNLKADPGIMLQDGPEPFDATARELEGDERAVWWERAVAAFPNYADYQDNTVRTIPVFLVSRRP